MKAEERSFSQLVKITLAEWNDDNCSRLAAALAYYTVFSLAPLLIVMIAVATLFFDQTAVRSQVVAQINGYTNSQQAAELIGSILENSRQANKNILATVIGGLILLYGATGVFSELKNSINQIWDTPPSGYSGFYDLLVNRLLALLMVFACGFLLLATLVANALLNFATTWLVKLWPNSTLPGQLTTFVFFFLITLLIFALVYKFLPDVPVAWRDVWVGAAVTALLFSLGRVLIVFYLGYSSITSLYGAAGSLVALLVWVYYSAQLFFLGAEFTQVYARTQGSHQAEESLLKEESVPTDAPGKPVPLRQPASLEETAVSLSAELTTGLTTETPTVLEPVLEPAPLPATPKPKQWFSWLGPFRRLRPIVGLATGITVIALFSLVNLLRGPLGSRPRPAKVFPAKQKA